MSMRLVAGGALVVFAALIAGRKFGPVRRLRGLPVRYAAAGAGDRTADRRMALATRVSVALAGCAAALLIGGWWGVLAGGLVACVVDRLLRRTVARSFHKERERAAADLPLAADLLAAALRAGMPVDRAATAVGAAIEGPLGTRLTRAGRALRLGASAEDGWRYVADVAGADRLVRAAVRSTASGSALAGALIRLADDLRAARAVAADASARRAGVLMVLPLGLCFLPAFVLAGLVPVVVAVLGDVW